MHVHYRIMGRLIGGVGGKMANQNVVCSLPMVVPRECVHLLLEMGVARLRLHSEVHQCLMEEEEEEESGKSSLDEPLKKKTKIDKVDSGGNCGLGHAELEEIWRNGYLVTPFERRCYAVFRDLHQRGYYVTSGDRFGVHYLIYHGDPLLYHASGMVHVMTDGGDAEMDILTLTSMARVATNARKTLVLASIDEGGDHNAVRYLSWSFYQPNNKERRSTDAI